ncbi:MAG: LysM domain-containing protein [Phycisphaerae bacterium]|nr:LysM domain-containing protein [Phycisphaerae bacterium]
MSKDLKIGMIIGVVLLIAATLMISFLSQGSLRSRLKDKFKKDTAAPEVIDNNIDEMPPKEIPPAEKPAGDGTRPHIVIAGQTINDIADKYYGNPMMIIKIVDANPQIPDNYELKAGMKLKIPK